MSCIKGHTDSEVRYVSKPNSNKISGWKVETTCLFTSCSPSFPWLKLHFETQTTTCQRQHLWCKRYFAVITTNGLAWDRGIFVVVQSNARFWSLPWLYLKHGICAFCYISGCSCMDAIDIRLGYIHTDFISHTSFYNFRSCIIALTLCLVMQQVTNRSVVMHNWLVYQDFHCKTYNLFMVLMMSTLYIIVQYCNYIPIKFWTHLLPAVLHTYSEMPYISFQSLFKYH